MKILSIDQHISVNADVQHTLNRLGHTVHILSLSGHSAVINRPSAKIPILQGDGWCHLINGRRTDEFYEIYKDEFDKYDAFLCCYPPIFSMLYARWNKPIIVYIPIRYECGAECNAELWEEFNSYLRAGVDAGKIILAANSVFDKKYAEGFLGRPVRHIPSLCEYSGMSYNPVYNQSLYFSAFEVKEDSGRMVKKHDILKAGHAWQTVADYRACFHYPYNASLMSLFEQYTANIPIFVPSKRYALEMWANGVPIFHQICWPATLGKAPGSLIKWPGEYDPNNYQDFNILSHWLDFADYYHDDALPLIQKFDSKEERDEILSWPVEKLLDISARMRIQNKTRKALVVDAWRDLLKLIQL